MRNFQLPIETFSSCYLDLTDPDSELVDYFRHIRMGNIRPVLCETYNSRGPKGHGSALWLSRMLKVKMGFYSDRILAKRLRECALFRILCGLNEQTPAHNTYHTFRSQVSVGDYRAIHRNFVMEAHEHGLLDIETPRLPKTRRPGLILLGDSTPLLAYCSTVGEK